MEPKIVKAKKNNYNRGLKCVVLNCNSKYSDNSELSFHRFPTQNTTTVDFTDYYGNEKKIDRFEAWKLALEIKQNKIAYYSRVCSLHFTSDDYFPPVEPTNKKVLRSHSVPSCNLPGKKTSTAALRRQDRHERNQRRLERSKKSENVEKNIKKKTVKIKVLKDKTNLLEKPDTFKTIPELKENVEQVVENCRNQDQDINSSMLYASEDSIYLTGENEGAETIFTEQEVSNISFCEDCEPFVPVTDEVFQIKVPQDSLNKEYMVIDFPEWNVPDKTTESCAANPVKTNFTDYLKSDKDLSAATGIETFKLLDTIVELVKLAIGDRFEKTYNVMKTRDRILMTYVKLKQNCTYSFLAILFNTVTEQRCKVIFCETIQILSKVLKFAIRWPSKEELSRNLPLCFEDFKSTRVVLDCTEIFIQKPKKLCCQIITYSNYKGNQTLKILTGVTPAGDISFISKPYGGRVTDATIFQQSELMNLLEKKDAIMVDKGFLLDELCKMNQWNLIQPPFLKEKKQFTAEEALTTSKIASARIHIERSNQRIKVFQILGQQMPVTLVRYFEYIMTVICATVNLSSPILKDDKFIKDD